MTAHMPIDFGPTINISQWTLFGLAFAAVHIRIWGRIRLSLAWHWDDFVLLWSLTFNLVACICSTVAVQYGVGSHIQDVKPQDLSPAIFWSTIAIDVALLADALPKLALALLINRLLNQRRWLDWVTVSNAVLLIVGVVVFDVLIFVQCQPSSKWWHPEQQGTCWSPRIVTNYGIAIGSYAAAIDLFVSIYPAIVVSQLKMQWSKKIIVMIMLGMSIFTFAVTVYKTAIQLPQLAYRGADYTYVIGVIMMWTLLEASVTTITASIPGWGWVQQTESFKKMRSLFRRQRQAPLLPPPKSIYPPSEDIYECSDLGYSHVLPPIHTSAQGTFDFSFPWNYASGDVSPGPSRRSRGLSGIWYNRVERRDLDSIRRIDKEVYT